jgi:hypothetical protein
MNEEGESQKKPKVANLREEGSDEEKLMANNIPFLVKNEQIPIAMMHDHWLTIIRFDRYHVVVTIMIVDHHYLSSMTMTLVIIITMLILDSHVVAAMTLLIVTNGYANKA